MKNTVIQLANVNKRFGALQAVRNVSFEIQRGQVCGFLGPNGAGKSTTIRMVMSILLPDSGSITVLGGSALDAKDRIGYLPEERGVYRKMRVADFLRFIAKLKGISRNDADTRIRAWLERVELPGVSQKRCEELSKGMQQNLQFIASVLHEPPLLILDEPFSGLDPREPPFAEFRGAPVERKWNHYFIFHASNGASGGFMRSGPAHSQGRKSFG